MYPAAGHILELKLHVVSISKNSATARLLEYVNKFVEPKRYAFLFHILGENFLCSGGVSGKMYTDYNRKMNCTNCVHSI